MRCVGAACTATSSSRRWSGSWRSCAGALPGIEPTLAAQIARFVRSLREEDLEKRPGVAETLDWAGALMGLGIETLQPDSKRLHATLICLLKTEADLKSVTPEVFGRLAGRGDMSAGGVSRTTGVLLRHAA